MTKRMVDIKQFGIEAKDPDRIETRAVLPTQTLLGRDTSNFHRVGDVPVNSDVYDGLAKMEIDLIAIRSRRGCDALKISGISVLDSDGKKRQVVMYGKGPKAYLINPAEVSDETKAGVAASFKMKLAPVDAQINELQAEKEAEQSHEKASKVRINSIVDALMPVLTEALLKISQEDMRELIFGSDETHRTEAQFALDVSSLVGLLISRGETDKGARQFTEFTLPFSLSGAVKKFILSKLAVRNNGDASDSSDVSAKFANYKKVLFGDMALSSGGISVTKPYLRVTVNFIDSSPESRLRYGLGDEYAPADTILVVSLLREHDPNLNEHYGDFENQKPLLVWINVDEDEDGTVDGVI